MTRLPRLLPSIAACVLAGLLPAAAHAAKPTYPSVAKASPLKLGVGDVLTLSGKNYRSGKSRNTVVFKRDGGRSIFVKAGRSTSKRISVTIPAKMLSALTQKAGKPVGTRFRLRVLAGRLGRRFTAAKSSPVIGPVARGGGAAVAKDDCDGDQIPNAKDTDDDNDLLPDTLEATLKTDPCKRDSDGDGMSDGWEYESALDYNGRAVPAPSKRPFPNALDGKDGAIDSDGDGLTNLAEYSAWATFGQKLPLSYSGGNPATGGKIKPAAGQEWFDRDANGFLSDNERDADGDGIPNQDEDGLDPLPYIVGTAGFFSSGYIDDTAVRSLIDVVPLYGQLDYVHKIQPLSWLDTDSDGDGVRDGADDQDHDGLSNVEETVTELAAGAKDKTQRPINPCVPYTDARLCVVGDDDIDNDGTSNRYDTDDDGDLLPDTLELSLGLNPYKADTDGDGVSDGYEYFSAKDLNETATPVAVDYPGKQPYPNALDKGDAGIDHDGDGLSLRNEYRAWRYTGSPMPLSYSDGNQFTGGGLLDGDKDVDADGVSNVSEAVGPLSGPAWWTGWVKDNACSTEYVETVYSGPNYQGLDFTDPDSDGDGLPDGADDIDHDGLTNLQEGGFGENGNFRSPRRADWCSVYVSVGPGVGHNAPNPATPGQDLPGADRYARVDPFNPCKPVNSAACHKFVPLGYYKKTDTYVEDWKGAEPNR